MRAAPERLGVVGAGTMGSGIAQLGCLAGMECVMHDPVPEALDRGVERVRAGLERGATRGRWSEEEARAAERQLRAVGSLDELRDADLVIEAAPERLELKRELLERLSGICGPDVLATNTSSILVSALAGAAGRPENVVGMHFLNPPPLMALVEVVAAAQSSPRAIEVAQAAAGAMGRRPIVVQDGPGFLTRGHPAERRKTFFDKGVELLGRVGEALRDLTGSVVPSTGVRAP